MKKNIKIILWIVLLLYTVFAFWLLFIHDRKPSGLGIIEHFKSYNNIIPLSTVIHDIKQIFTGNYTAMHIRNFFGNIMLIFPFGLLLPYLTDRYKSVKRIFILFVVVIITVELSQLLFRVGSVDTDDFMFNMAGGMAGYEIYRKISLKRLDNDV